MRICSNSVSMRPTISITFLITWPVRSQILRHHDFHELLRGRARGVGRIDEESPGVVGELAEFPAARGGWRRDRPNGLLERLGFPRQATSAGGIAMSVAVPDTREASLFGHLRDVVQALGAHRARPGPLRRPSRSPTPGASCNWRASCTRRSRSWAGTSSRARTCTTSQMTEQVARALAGDSPAGTAGKPNSLANRLSPQEFRELAPRLSRRCGRRTSRAPRTS